MTEYTVLRERLMDRIASSKNQRVRPTEVKQQLAQEMNLTPSVINEVIKDLVRDGELVYAYRDPCSYVEIPCNGCEGGHRAARPMKVVQDIDGNPWLCDADVQPQDHLLSQSCWECSSMNFTRGG